MAVYMQEIDVADLRRISELIYERYNYDFRNYAMSSFRRRVLRILELKKLTVPNLLSKLIDTPPFIHEFVDELTVNVTEMFRDPGFWKVIRDEVIPAIRKTQKKFTIWHAGCSSGEEVLTMAIVLDELGVLEDAQIIATDIDSAMLERGRAGIYPIKNMAVNEQNYNAYAGNSDGLSWYYEQVNGSVIFRNDLLNNVTFARHDLVMGQVFDRFDLVLCRNVMIYFNQELQNEVLKKFHESIVPNGFLCIGSKESLIWCDYGNRFLVVNNDEKIYRKMNG